MLKSIYLLLLLLLIAPTAVFSQKSYDGIILGTIIDAETQSPVEDAVIEILNTGNKTTTDSTGNFFFQNLKYDSYQIKISGTGYDPLIKSDLIVYASKPLELIIKLNSKGIITDQIDVEANYFQKSSDVNISSLNLDFEEIRRAPGATEDISRMIQTIPGVSIGNDQRNDIIVRGGSPAENLILIDGIEIPNINHFGTDGSTSGAIGFINVKFIQETGILTGGFPTTFGDKLSSVIDINFREGSKKKFYSDINLSIAGFGGIFEGPLSEKGSYLFSVRRSYLELIKNSIRLTSVPNYWDFNLKADYEISPKDKITLIGLLGLDKIDFSEESAENNPYGNSQDDQKTFAAGINYKKLFKKGFIQTVLSDSYTDNYIVQIDGQSALIKFENKANNNEIILKSDLNYQLSSNLSLNTGIGGKYAGIKNYLFLKGDTNAAGFVFDTINADSKFNAVKLFGHANLTSKFLKDRLVVNTGVRLDYFDYIRLKTYFSPRIGASYKITPVTSLNAAAGIYYQSPEYIWLSSHPDNKNLNSIRSDHYILGLDHFFSGDLKATVELFYKNYKDYPVWKDIPTYILIDGGTEFGPNIVGEAVSAGTGYVKGIDVSLQKKLSSQKGLYGIINYSYINTGFTALAGGEKPGAFDPGHQFTLIAGYQFSSGWLAGLKFKYSGGRPYTPLDYDASKRVNREVYATDDFNSARYPYYMRIDMRVDKKFDFSKASLVCYIELQNLFDRENIYSYYWNEDNKKPGTIYQWAFFPVGGISIQF
ncbi:MAG: carboxypeptidase regulatory-like domain-containing protein [Ignavibacteria bacterium]|nr:carboxypeptidase regulatory-like domain-containing protein [Ignavibacteria bacterium]